MGWQLYAFPNVKLYYVHGDSAVKSDLGTLLEKNKNGFTKTNSEVHKEKMEKSSSAEKATSKKEQKKQKSNQKLIVFFSWCRDSTQR